MGFPSRSLKIIQAGLDHNANKENLILYALKTANRLGNISLARSILSGLRFTAVEKSWKMLVEVRGWISLNF